MQIDKRAKNITYSCARFSVGMAVTIRIAVFWHVMSYCLVEIFRLYIHETKVATTQTEYQNKHYDIDQKDEGT